MPARKPGMKGQYYFRLEITEEKITHGQKIKTDSGKNQYIILKFGKCLQTRFIVAIWTISSTSSLFNLTPYS